MMELSLSPCPLVTPHLLLTTSPPQLPLVYLAQGDDARCGNVPSLAARSVHNTANFVILGFILISGQL